MSIKGRTFGYAVLAAGFLAAAAPAFAAGDGGNPSSTTGGMLPGGNSLPTNSPAGSQSNPQHGAASRRTAQKTSTHASTTVKPTPSAGQGTSATTN